MKVFRFQYLVILALARIIFMMRDQSAADAGVHVPMGDIEKQLREWLSEADPT